MATATVMETVIVTLGNIGGGGGGDGDSHGGEEHS
jgi:hypothetical protein